LFSPETNSKVSGAVRCTTPQAAAANARQMIAPGSNSLFIERPTARQRQPANDISSWRPRTEERVDNDGMVRCIRGQLEPKLQLPSLMHFPALNGSANLFLLTRRGKLDTNE
jgi:hypothetical protein